MEFFSAQRVKESPFTDGVQTKDAEKTIKKESAFSAGFVQGATSNKAEHLKVSSVQSAGVVP